MNPKIKEKWLNEIGEYLVFLLMDLIPLLITIGIYTDGSNITSTEYMLIGIMSFWFMIITITLITICIHDLYICMYNKLLEWVESVSNDIAIDNDLKIANEIYIYVDEEVKKCKQ